MLADDEDHSSETFRIPKTDLTLTFDQFGPLLEPSSLRSFFLKASSDVEHQIHRNIKNGASCARWYHYKSDGGLVLEIWNRSVSPDGYLSLDELRKIVKALSLYMVQQERSRTLQFKVIQDMGTTKAIIIATGYIRQDIALAITRAKREAPPLPLIQNTSSSPVTSPSNASILNLSKANDFPIPHSDYSLRFGNLGSQLHPWDLETLLIAVSAQIEEEIATHGRNARLPSSEYSKTLVGLQLWIQKMPWDTINLAWAELAIFVDGLWGYIVDGKHDRECFIDVINHVSERQVALGWIGKPHVPSLSTSLTGAARRGLEAPMSPKIS